MPAQPTRPLNQDIIRRLIDALRKCNDCQAPLNPEHVALTLLSLIQIQYPKGPTAAGSPEQKDLGCCDFGTNMLPNWFEVDCTGAGGTWTLGPCPPTR